MAWKSIISENPVSSQGLPKLIQGLKLQIPALYFLNQIGSPLAFLSLVPPPFSF